MEGAVGVGNRRLQRYIIAKEKKNWIPIYLPRNTNGFPQCVCMRACVHFTLSESCKLQPQLNYFGIQCEGLISDSGPTNQGHLGCREFYECY